MAKTVLIYNARLVDANIDRKNSAILLSKGKIAGFPEKAAVRELLKDSSVEKYDANGCAVIPSFIDMHAHFRDPGLTQKEDIETGCRAAAAGGYAVCVLMPNTKPVISDMERAEENRRKALLSGCCAVFQSVSITRNFDGKTTDHLETLDAKKIPLITEDGKDVCDSAVMLSAMKIAAKKNIIVSCHCEDSFLASQARELRQQALGFLREGNRKNAAAFFARADRLLELAEDTATFRNLRLAQEAGCRIHLCHVSTAACIEAAKAARKNGVNVTLEITPHHLFMNGEKSPGIFAIVNPPLRSERNRLALVNALADGTADCIATDHAPHTAEDKKNGSPGFSGLETAFSACYTMLVKNGGMTLSRLSQLMSENPAQILGLKKQGLLAEGYEANVIIADTESQRTIRGESFASKGKFTPFEGKKLFGVIKAAFFRGSTVFQK